MEGDDLRRETTFGGRGPSVEDELWWKMTYAGRQPSVEDDLLWKTALTINISHESILIRVTSTTLMRVT